MGRGARSALLVAILSAFPLQFDDLRKSVFVEDCLGRLVS